MLMLNANNNNKHILRLFCDLPGIELHCSEAPPGELNSRGIPSGNARHSRRGIYVFF